MVICSLVSGLGKAGKIVALAAHNANLAVRTLPYSSIYREHVNGKEYRTHVGNPFIDKLVDVDGLANSLSFGAKRARGFFRAVGIPSTTEGISTGRGLPNEQNGERMKLESGEEVLRFFFNYQASVDVSLTGDSGSVNLKELFERTVR